MLSVIVPVHNGGDDLRRCLEALAASTRSPDEVIVVDDGSTDGSGDLARQLGARVVRLAGSPRGPAFARNRGAEEARGDVLVFLDADVAVHPDTLTLVEQYLGKHPEIAALFGSYDDDPPARGLVSRYKNLMHHYVHQHGRREAATFWAGCGAIRRDVFAALGGFDESYTHPAIEDVELGARLRRAGHRIWLCPGVQVAHLKRWTFANLLRSDIFDRAVPWTRLILRDGRLPADLNLSAGGRASALAAWMTLVCLALGFLGHWAWIGALLGVVALAALNLDLYRFFARKGGIGLAAGASALHVLYLLYSSLTFVLMVVPNWLARRGLALVLLVTLFKGLAWSIIVPPWHAPDEHVQFSYGQLLERFGVRYRGPNVSMPAEIGQVWQLVQFEDVHFTPRPLDLSDRARIAEQIACLGSPKFGETHVGAMSGLGFLRSFMSFHPPLYHTALAVVQWGLEDQSILVRILACRWLSVALGVVTVALAYQAGRTLWPGRPGWALLLATLVSFQPMFTFFTAIVGNQALEIALFSACLWVSLQVVRRGLGWRYGLVLGVLVGLSLLTKMSSLSLLPLLAVLFAWDVVRLRRGARRWRALWPWILSVLLPVLLGGWWYRDAVLSGGDSVINAFRPITERSDVRLLPYLLRYDWPAVYHSVLNSYWGYFGWLDTPLPRSLLAVLTLATVIAAWTAGWWCVRRVISRPFGPGFRRFFPLLFLGCATLGFVAFYTYLDFRMARDLGGFFGIQGRYFLPPIIGQMAWLALGLTLPVPKRLRRAWAWLVGVGMVALNLYALFGVVAPRYYGVDAPLVLLERATVLQPVSLPALLAICAALVALTGALVVALWGALGDRHLCRYHSAMA